MDTIVPSLSVLLFQLPILLVWLVGLVLAVIYWKRHPRVSLLAIIGIVGLLISTMLGSLASLWMPMICAQNGYPGGLQQYALLMPLNTFAGSLLSAAFWVLVIIAIFFGRKKPDTAQ